MGVSESCIRYHLKSGALKKGLIKTAEYRQGSTPGERNIVDFEASRIIGTAATRVRRKDCRQPGALGQTPVRFESCQGLEHAGVLLMLPALLAQGPMGYKQHYRQVENVYYGLDATILFLSFMYLCRIHNPEQLRHISPGEFGKLLGLDRVPEARCLRAGLRQVVGQNKSVQWGMSQANEWASGRHNNLLYKRKTGEMLSGQVIPMLKDQVAPVVGEQELLDDAELPRFTMTFDREGYGPKAFKS